MSAQASSVPANPQSGLHRRLLVFVVLPLMLISALAIQLGLQQASTIQEERMKMDLDLIGRAIRIPVGSALAADDSESMQLALQSLFSIGRVYGVSVFDASGALLASAGVTEEDLTDSRIPGTIVETGQTQEDYREVDGRSVFSHFLPVFDTGGQIAGLIQLNRRASDFETALDRLSLIAWLVWFGFSLAIILIVLLGHYSGVGRHVDKLLAHMRRIESGEQEHRAEVTGPSEVRAIADGLNRMLDSIEASQRRILEHQLNEQRLSSQLRDSEKMATVGRMTRGIAHELGAPLNVIDARAKRLSKYLQSPLEKREIDGVRSQISRLTRTVYQLLDYSRPDEPDLADFEMHSLIRSATDALRPEIEAAGLELAMDIPDRALAIRGNIKRLEIALLNVLRNAVQAADTLVRIRVSVGKGHLIVEVEDDGPGLGGTSTDQLIEPFYTTKPAGQGTGLGLAITQNIVEEHGGKLSLADIPEGGCRVSMELPVEPGKALEVEAP